MPHPARFAGALLAIGATLLGVGYWIEGKAWLAQRLLERSWIAHLEDGRAHPPWPWADHHPVARLLTHGVAGGDQDFIVLNGDAGNVLAFAPGHTPGSVLPGSDETIVISGHRDTHFRFLEHLPIAAEIELQARGTTTRFSVIGRQIVDARTWRQPIRTDRRLILVTGWPVGAVISSPARLLIIAEAIDRTSAPLSTQPHAVRALST